MDGRRTLIHSAPGAARRFHIISPTHQLDVTCPRTRREYYYH